MASHKYFSESNWKVNRESSTVYGVSIITEGEAKGHGLQIDHTTLEEVMACAQQYENGLKVKLDHGSGVAAIFGTVDNFRIQNNKLLGDLHILESHPQHNFILDLIENQPDTLGFSIHFKGNDREIDGVRFASCDEIFSCDLVGEPAANPSGVFEAKQEVKILSSVKARKSKEKKSMEPTLGTTSVSNGTTITLTGKVENGKWVFTQPDLFTQEVDKSETINMSATQTNSGDSGKPTHPAEDPDLIKSMGERLSALEAALASYFPKKDNKEEMSQADGADASTTDAAPAEEPKKQAATASYQELSESQVTLIQQTVIKEFAKIGVSAIKANPQIQAPLKEEGEKKFEDLIKEQVAAGKSKTEAVNFCIDNHAEAHRKFINNGGAHF